MTFFRSPAPKVKPSQRTKVPPTFYSAIRRGMADEVAQLIRRGEFQFTDDNGEALCPFKVALEHRRWSVALVIWEHRREHEKMLPSADEPREGEQLHPLQAGTRQAQALMAFLEALSFDRTRQPLPKAEMVKLKDMVAVVGEQDNNPIQTFMRVIHNGPQWLAQSYFQGKPWAQLPANAFVVNPNTGADLFLLGTAALRGHLATVDALLEKGANPLHKNYQHENAAHLAADLKRYQYMQNGAYDLNVLEGRLACFNRLIALDGVADMKDYSGKTPTERKEESLAWLLSQPMPSGDGVTTEMRAAYKQRLHDLLLPPAPQGSRRPRM